MYDRTNANLEYAKLWLEIERIIANIRVVRAYGMPTDMNKIRWPLQHRGICYNGEDLASKVLLCLQQHQLQGADHKMAAEWIEIIVDSMMMPWVIEPHIMDLAVDSEREQEQTGVLQAQAMLMDLAIRKMDREEMTALASHLGTVKDYARDPLSAAKWVTDVAHSVAKWVADVMYRDSQRLNVHWYKTGEAGIQQIGIDSTKFNSSGAGFVISYLQKKHGVEKDDWPRVWRWIEDAKNDLGLTDPSISDEDAKSVMKKPRLSTIPYVLENEDIVKIVRYLQAYNTNPDARLPGPAKSDYYINKANLQKAMRYLTEKGHANTDEDCALLWLRAQGRLMSNLLSKIAWGYKFGKEELFNAEDIKLTEEHLLFLADSDSRSAANWLEDSRRGFADLLYGMGPQTYEILKITFRLDYVDFEDDEAKEPRTFCSHDVGTVLMGLDALLDMDKLILGAFMAGEENAARLVRYFKIYDPPAANQKYAIEWLKKRRNALQAVLAKREQGSKQPESEHKWNESATKVIAWRFGACDPQHYAYKQPKARLQYLKSYSECIKSYLGFSRLEMNRITQKFSTGPITGGEKFRLLQFIRIYNPLTMHDVAARAWMESWDDFLKRM